MTKIHLRINYGGEKRYSFVSKTLKVSYSYFDTIRIANFGENELHNAFGYFPNLQISNLGKHYHLCITEDLLRNHIMDVPDGDWVVWIDSDWRLPQYFLDHMQEEIAKCEKEGFNHLYSYQLGHTMTNIPYNTFYGTRSFEFDEQMTNAFVKGCEDNPGNYGWPILQKIDKKNLWCDSFLGNHTYYLHVPYNKKLVPNMYHYHFRDFGEWAYCSTMLYQSWWYIGHNVFDIKDHEQILKSWEYKAIELFKKEHKCFTSNQLREKIKSPEFLNKLEELFLMFKDSNIFGCKQFYYLAFNYKMKLWTTPDEIECNGICCQYKEGRIFDL